jgi:broad specificity phosphatase PhoE
VVSHGAAIKSFAAHALATTTFGLRPLRPIANTGVTLFERTAEGGLSLLVYNDTTHLEDALAAALAS